MDFLDPPSIEKCLTRYFYRMVFLCELSRDWSVFFWLGFLNTTLVLIHPISNGSLGFSNVLATTFIAIYNANHI